MTRAVIYLGLSPSRSLLCRLLRSLPSTLIDVEVPVLCLFGQKQMHLLQGLRIAASHAFCLGMANELGHPWFLGRGRWVHVASNLQRRELKLKVTRDDNRRH